MELTQEEIEYLKDFILDKKTLEKLEKQEEQEKEILNKKILSGEFKGKKNNPNWICNKCGKVIIKTWGTARQFPQEKYRCKCKPRRKRKITPNKEFDI